MQRGRGQILGEEIEPLRLAGASRPSSRRNAILGYLRQLCVSGVDSHVIAPRLLEASRELVGGDWAGICWPDERGFIREIYVENPDLYSLVPAYTQSFGGSRLEREAFGVDFPTAMQTGIGWRNLDRHRERLKRSPYYHALYHPLGIRHGLEVTAREQRRGWGALMLYRGSGSKAFRLEDEQLLTQLSPLLAHAFRARASVSAPFVESGDTGLILSDERGRVIATNDNELPLLLMLRQGSRERGLLDLRRLPSFLMPLVTAAAELSRGVSAAKPIGEHTNAWGRFQFRAYAMRSPEGGGLAPLVALHVRRFEPLSARVLRNAWRAGLSERQREVCLHIAKGISHSEIARLMCVRPSTVIDYVRKIYMKLNIGSREQLLRLLSG
jgi:DNA-binding CsgD family transcriptional regulator